jgi:uncharacterized damage-inducible protein DinB
MDAELTSVFLSASTRRLAQYLDRIRQCLDRLSEDQVWTRGSENENAPANLLLHLAGNVRQWIISGIGSKPDVRVRDREFSARGEISKQELLERLESAVEQASEVIAALTPERLRETVVIQGYQITVLEAVFHVVEHFAQHTGQIIFATKILTHQDLGFYRHLGKPASPVEKTP